MLQQVGGDEPPPRSSAQRRAAVRTCFVRSTVSVDGCRSVLSLGDEASDRMRYKRPKIWLDVLTLGSGLLCFYAVVGLAFYFVWARIDSSMETMWTIKRKFYVPVLIGSLIIGVPLWVLFLRDCIRNRKDT